MRPRTSHLRVSADVDLASLRNRYPTTFRAPLGARLLAPAVTTLAVCLALYALWRFNFSLTTFIDGLSKLGTVAVLIMPPNPGNQLWNYVGALGETLSIAFLGTLAAAIIALPVSMLAAKNVVANRIIHIASRRFLDTIRGVDTLIWALIWINVVGLGPFAGILAIMTSDFGSFGKLFSEAIEAADRKPVEGIVAAGGSRLQAFRFGVLPQVLPVLSSQVLYYFESNTRSATIIGIVGAGGIGLYLTNEIAQAEWQHVGFLILISCRRATIDWISRDSAGDHRRVEQAKGVTWMKTRIVLVALAVTFMAISNASSLDKSLPAYQQAKGISGRINSVGSDSLNTEMGLWSKGFMDRYPDVKIEVEGKGSATAPPALLGGSSQLGPMSRPMSGEEVDAFEKKYGYKPFSVRVAVDALAVYVHKDNPVPCLTLQQLNRIFSSTRKGPVFGRDITTWGEVGLTGEWAASRSRCLAATPIRATNISGNGPVWR